MKLPGIKYYLFAAIATISNLVLQFLCTRIGESVLTVDLIHRKDIIYISAWAVGTGLSSVLKYILDKVFIFKYQTDTLKKNLVTFFFYGIMSLVTTGIFFGIQSYFEYILQISKYIGGFIGLGIGYTVKYFLDRKFVFIERDK
ncbi:MAG: GtrA family protein [Spirochaetales bacterium]|nr:GtrA family protein [Spirochaetales bacterium]